MRIAAALLACAVVLTGCGGSEASGTRKEGGGSKPAGTTVEIVIKDGKVTPQGERVDITAGEPVKLSIASDVAEEIHVHSDPEHTYEVSAGEPLTETFTVDTPGQVAVEAHHLDVTIVQLVVEP